MKNIELKTIKSDSGTELQYKELILTAVKAPPQGGFDPDTMRKRMRVVDAVELAEKKNQPIQLEDEDVSTLKQCVKTVKWAILDKGIIAFIDEISAL